MEILYLKLNIWLYGEFTFFNTSWGVIRKVSKNSVALTANVD